jgi:uncharacterized protein
MQTFIKVTIVIFLGLTISCNRKLETGPKLEDRIIDNSHLLSKPQKDSIFKLIKKLDQEIGSQIAVMTIDTIGNEGIEGFSLRMTEDLRLGRSTHNDGLLITIVTMQKKMRIEVGTGLENIIKDEIAAQIIREEMIPSFRQKKYGRGIYLAVNRISKLIIDNKELVGTPPK